MTDEQIKHMVDRFLNWRLPDNFSPDAGISFKAEFNEHTAHPMRHEPRGTNLFDARQAEAMIRHLIGDAQADNSVGAAEAAVGRVLYQRQEELMNAHPGSPEAEELIWLTQVIIDVEEYGERSMAGLSLLPSPTRGKQREADHD